MLKRSKWNGLNLKLLLVSVLFFAPISESRELRDYNIWNDKLPGKKDLHGGASAKRRKNEGNDLDFPVEPRGREGKILSFFYPSTESECLAEDRRRSGTCLNPYRCHQKGGTSSGFCAHGFGVCCVFTVTCGKEIKHNLTYFVSPEFPSLARSLDSCTLTVYKMEGASQIRLDFVHFNLGQPNRLTGDCDSDLFVMSGGGSKDFRLCGINSGQHVYYDIDNKVKSVTMRMRLGRRTLQRLWEIRVTQVPFAQRAPADCAQYFTTDKGIIESFNFADNGRHLANQNYKACVRQNKGMCSIAYEPCDEESFRIGPSLVQGNQYAMGYGDTGMFGTGPGSFGTGPGSFGTGPGSFGNGPGSFGNGPGSFVMPGQFGGPGSESISEPVDQDISETQDAQMIGEPLENTAEVMGSGDGPVATRSDEDKVNPSSFWNPYTQFLSATQNGEIPELWRYSGYGNYGQGTSSFGRQGCRDRIVTPCDGDEFLGTTSYSPGSCDPYHCGPSLCQGRPRPPQQRGRAGARPLCRIETSATPFFVAIKFGPPAPKPNPEANIGMCLKYEQVPCA